MLGGSWSFIMPLVNIIIFVFVFSKIMGARLEILGGEFSEYTYSIYLVSGILAWTAFANTVSRVTNVFQEKSGLIGKVNMSLSLLPVYIVFTETIIFLISLFFFFIFMLAIDFPFSKHMFWLPLIYMVQQIFAYALGFFCAIFSVFFKDIKELVTVGLQLWFWLTPIVYVVSILPENYITFFMMNPVYHLMEAYRDVVLYQRAPEGDAIFIISLLSIGFLLLGLFFFRKLERDIRDFI
jgi:lipopolysaccharide transport system permease protein